MYNQHQYNTSQLNKPLYFKMASSLDWVLSPSTNLKAYYNLLVNTSFDITPLAHDYSIAFQMGSALFTIDTLSAATRNRFIFEGIKGANQSVATIKTIETE